MKLSTIMLIAAVALFVGVLTAYNLSLKAAYLRGTFRDRFGEHTFNPLKNVKELQLKSANMIGMSIEQGEKEGVWISDRVKNLIKVKQTGETATIESVIQNPENYMLVGTGDVVMMVNKLSKLTTHNYKVEGKNLENYGGQLNIIGLKGKSFDMVIDEQASVNVLGADFKRFKAEIGGNRHWSSLLIDGSTRIDTAYFDIKSKSSLQLQDPRIGVPHFKFGDSSKVELWGRVAQRIAK